MRFIAIASVVCASRRDRAEAHRAGGEALDDLLGRFDFVQRNRGRRELNSIRPRMVSSRSLWSLMVRVKAWNSAGRLPRNRVLQLGDRFRGPGMRLAAQAEGVVAADIQHVAVDRVVAIGVAVAGDGFLGDFVEADALDRGGGAGEALSTKAEDRPTASKICAPQ